MKPSVMIAYEKRATKMEALYRKGQTLQQIGDRFDITRERVRQILAERGVTKHDRLRLNDPVEKYGDQVRAAYAVGHPSCKRLADSLGISDTAVRKIIRKLNIVRIGKVERTSKYTREKVIVAMTGARNMTDAARRLGTYQSSIYRLVHRYGLYDLVAKTRANAGSRIMREGEVAAQLELFEKREKIVNEKTKESTCQAL